MSYDTIEVTREGPVTTLRLARLPVNAVNRRMMDELTQFCSTVADDRDVRAIVLASSGDKAFCAGIDLKQVRADRDHGAGDERLAMRLAKESMLRVEDLDESDGYRIEQDYTFRLRHMHDSAEALEAYLEGRDPQWTWS